MNGIDITTMGPGSYKVVQIFGRSEYVHRLAFWFMNGKIPPIVDHVNHDKSDNRWENLRGSNKSLNGLNRAKRVGAYLDKRNGKWRASITIAGKIKHLGGYETEEQAAEVAHLARLEHFKAAYGY